MKKPIDRTPDHAIDQASSEYDRVCDQAYAEYNHAIDQARAEYDLVCDQAYAEYRRMAEPPEPRTTREEF